jgi:hypothetical protein
VTPTGTQVAEKGMELVMSDKDLATGDEFHLYFYLHNPDTEAYSCDAYVLLGVYGMYWCWPSWASLDQAIDCKRFDVPASDSVLQEVLQFDWPAGVGQATNLEFIGCAFEPSAWDMIGELNYFTWGYH